MLQAGSRKRPAPGASPIVQQQQAQPSSNFNMTSPRISNEQMIQWGQDSGINEMPSYPDPSTNFSPDIYNAFAQTQALSPEPSNQLARRSMNTQRTLTRGNFNSGEDQVWPSYTNGAVQSPREDSWVKDDDTLEQKALNAKRKRKLIPPFVQKLSSFLDESRNTELIRWSPKGDSFIVVDEDEFAKTLIPELFKHNNYASFVRQLNMYGFHKKVGLSDNSMRASEKKNKSPSEYYNPYFKRGRPNLLWLIQKPKPSQGKGKGKKQEEATPEIGADEVYDVESPVPINQGVEENGQNSRGGRHPLLIGQGGGTGLPQEDLAAVHQELQTVRQHHQLLSGAIQKLKRDNEKQAAAFQELHTRHENSINAILTFLATVYNRSLEGHNAPNLANLFAGAIPHDTQNQGNVVDMGDFVNSEASTPNGQVRRPFRRQPLLLQAPPSDGQAGRSLSVSPATSGVIADKQFQTNNAMAKGQSNGYQEAVSSFANRHEAVQELVDQSPSTGNPESPQFTATAGTNSQLPERDIMSLINSANANDANFPKDRMDFPQALSHLQTADGNSPLTTKQHNNISQLILNGNKNTVPAASSNNVLALPNPPELPAPNIQHWNSSKDELDYLEKTLREQDSKMANLSSMLSPLSPSGSIPGLTDSQSYGGPNNPDPFDIDQIFNSGDYFNGTTDSTDFNFGNGNTDFDGGGDFEFGNYTSTSLPGSFEADDHDGESGRIVETVNSSEATSPANIMDDGGGIESGTSPKKRRRMN